MWIPAVSPVKSTQWAAVKICWLSIKDPPQTWFNETSQGQAYFDQKRVVRFMNYSKGNYATHSHRWNQIWYYVIYIISDQLFFIKNFGSPYDFFWDISEPSWLPLTWRPAVELHIRQVTRRRAERDIFWRRFVLNFWLFDSKY